MITHAPLGGLVLVLTYYAGHAISWLVARGRLRRSPLFPNPQRKDHHDRTPLDRLHHH